MRIKAETATSAMGGLEKLREDPDKFGLVLSDFNMPEMSGGEMCLEVKKDNKLCHLPFICTSGNHLTQEDKNVYKIDDTLMKPFTIDLLQEALVPYLQKPEAPPAAVSESALPPPTIVSLPPATITPSSSPSPATVNV